jgi:hypothetical protein
LVAEMIADIILEKLKKDNTWKFSRRRRRQ